MIIRPGQLIDAASGSLGGLTFAVGSSGQVVKRRPVCVERKTEAQQRVQAAQNALLREFQTNYASYYKSLVAAQALTQRVNRLGRRVPRTSYQMFMSWAMPFYLANGYIPGLPLTPIVTPMVVNVTMTLSLAGTFDVAVTTPASGAIAYSLIVEAARSFRTSAPRHWRGWKLFTGMMAQIPASTGHYSFKSKFLAALGTPALGESVAFAVRLKGCEGIGSPLGHFLGAWFDSERAIFTGNVVA